MFLHLSVSHSVHRGGRAVNPSMHWADTPPLGRHPLGRHLPGKILLGQILLGRHPPGHNPSGQTPLGRHPLVFNLCWALALVTSITFTALVTAARLLPNMHPTFTPGFALVPHLTLALPFGFVPFLTLLGMRTATVGFFCHTHFCSYQLFSWNLHIFSDMSWRSRAPTRLQDPPTNDTCSRCIFKELHSTG